MKARLGSDFGVALCKHFNLSTSQVLEGVKVNTARAEVFSATLTIALTADDLACIAALMADG
jgi:hypothetical protein